MLYIPYSGIVWALHFVDEPSISEDLIIGEPPQ
jgi:hypothetical protein